MNITALPKEIFESSSRYVHELSELIKSFQPRHLANCGERPASGTLPVQIFLYIHTHIHIILINNPLLTSSPSHLDHVYHNTHSYTHTYTDLLVDRPREKKRHVDEELLTSSCLGQLLLRYLLAGRELLQ